MIFDSNKRPVPIKPTKSFPIRWIYLDTFIEVVWMDRYFVVQSRPMGANYEPIDYFNAMWPVSNYRDNKETARHINKLLVGMCVATEQNKYPQCEKDSYTKEAALISFLQSTKHRKLPIEIVSAQLFSVKAAAKEQLSLFA